MPLNKGWIGRQAPPSEPYYVSREKIREFATAIGDQNPAYHDLAAAKALGHPDLIAPPTFAIVVGLKMGAVVFDPDLGLNYAMVVHGEQQFSYRRAIRAGDELTGTLTITDISAKGRNELLTWSADLTAADGEVVCTLTNTIVSRGTAPEAEG